jgi:hypothetical protein
MRGRVTTMVVAVGVLALQPSVGAQVPEHITEVPKAAYAYGSQSGVSPQSDAEDFACAVQWDVWSTAFISKAVPREIEDALPYEVGAYQSNLAKTEWRNKVARSRETTPMLVMIDLIKKTPARQARQDRVSKGLQGDKNALFRAVMNLATCQP